MSKSQVPFVVRQSSRSKQGLSRPKRSKESSKDEEETFVPKFYFDSKSSTSEEEEIREKINARELRHLAINGGIGRVSSMEYDDAVLFNEWPEDGLVLARSFAAERVLTEQFGWSAPLEKDLEQWWPARLVSIEEYLEYYSSTMVRFRPKFNAVGLIFLLPWWSEYVAEENSSEANSFELEAIEAKSRHIRNLYPPRPKKYRQLTETERRLPALFANKKKLGRTPQLPATRTATSVQYETRHQAPRLPSSINSKAQLLFHDALRMASSLREFALSKLGPVGIHLNDTELWRRRYTRLERALSEASASWKAYTKRFPHQAKLDVSTATLDVVNYPAHILNLDWPSMLQRSTAKSHQPLQINASILDTPCDLQLHDSDAIFQRVSSSNAPRTLIRQPSLSPAQVEAMLEYESNESVSHVDSLLHHLLQESPTKETHLNNIQLTAEFTASNSDQEQSNPAGQAITSNSQNSAQPMQINEDDELLESVDHHSAANAQEETIVAPVVPEQKELSSHTTDEDDDNPNAKIAAVAESDESNKANSIFLSDGSDEKEHQIMVAELPDEFAATRSGTEKASPPSWTETDDIMEEAPLELPPPLKKLESSPVTTRPMPPAPKTKKRYRFTEAFPVADEEERTSRWALERVSDHQWPSLHPPSEALLDPNRGLIYGDNAFKACTSTVEVLSVAKVGEACPDEVWLYLTSRAAARQHHSKQSASTATMHAMTRKSSRVRTTSARLADAGERYSPQAQNNSHRLTRATPEPAAPALPVLSCSELAQSFAERELAALLAQMPEVIVSCAASQLRTATGQAQAARARSDRSAALELLSSIDRKLESLFGADERRERDKRRAATRQMAALRAIHDDSSATEMELEAIKVEADAARHSLREIKTIREAWSRARATLYFRACGGIATLNQEEQANHVASKNIKRKKKKRARPDDSAFIENGTSEDTPQYSWEQPCRRPRTLAIYDQRYRLHGTKPVCVEQSRRAVAAASVIEAVAAKDQLLWVERSVPNEYVSRAQALLAYAHDRSYLAELRRRCDELESNATMLFGADDDDTSGNRGTWDASVAASAAVLAAIDAVACGEAKNALCAVRPPGHHAGASLGALGAPTNGYCILNHAALGAKYAVHERGLRRVAVLDFDVHHGNGTEDVLARTYDPSFLFISVHAAGEDIYPGTGRSPANCLAEARRQAEEEGATPIMRRRSSSILQPPTSMTEDTRLYFGDEDQLTAVSFHPGVLNLPLEPPPVTTEWLLRLALPRIIRELEAFGPELVVLSAGFDAHRRDPVNLGRLDAADYGEFTRHILTACDRLCCGRVVSVLEGGYGVDCDPSGNYIPSIRREAFDSCLRSHLLAMVHCGANNDTSDEELDIESRDHNNNRSTPSPPPPTIMEDLASREKSVNSFFRQPPQRNTFHTFSINQGGRRHTHQDDQHLTPANLAQLGEPGSLDLKMRDFLQHK